MDSQSHQPPLTIYFIPFVASSHLVSLFELSRLFAARCQHVTILTTPFTFLFLRKSILKAHASVLPLHVHNFSFPSQQVGLPDGVENFIAVDDLDTAAKVYQGMRLLRPQMEQFMEQNPPDCTVSDVFHPWTSDFAIRLGIPRQFFDGSGVFPACLMEAVRGPDSPHRNVSSETDPFIIPGLPHSITMTLSQLPDNVKTQTVDVRLIQMVEEFRDSELRSYGRIINSFAELEGEYTEHYRNTTGLKVWHAGPTSLLNRTSEEKSERNIETVVSEQECLSWLNSKRPDSVLYICFGSSCFFPDNQLYEIASAIESSGHEFIWVIHGKHRMENQEEREKWMTKEFEERIMKRENRGMIVWGWAPQTLNLDHVAVGGLMTHCGLITWPLTAEQFYNEKLITQVQGIGVEVGAEEWALTAVHDKKKVVTRDRIEEAGRKLMDDGDEGVRMRRRARELQEEAKAAMEEGGSSQRNLTALIQDLTRLRSIRTSAYD